MAGPARRIATYQDVLDAPEQLPDEAFLTLAPDWICEVLSAVRSTTTED